MIQKSIANRIVLLISCGLVISFAIIGGFTATIAKQQVLEYKTQETRLKAESVSKDVIHIFENARLATNQMALHPEIIQYLKYADSKTKIKDNPYLTSAVMSLSGIRKVGQSYEQAWIGGETASFYLNDRGYTPDATYQISKRPWYLYASTAVDVAYTPPYVDWETKKTIISCIKPLREGGKIFGYVAVDFSMEDLPKIFQKGKVHPEDKNFLIAGDGTYLYHENLDRIMKTRIEDPSDPMYPLRSDIQNTNFQLTNVYYEGAPYFLMAYPVNDNGWKVVYLIDKNRVDQYVNQLLQKVIGLMVTVLVVLLGMVYWMVRHGTRHFSVVLKFAEDIAQGKTDKNIPEAYMKQSDELGQMSVAFQKIIQAFRNENKQLENRIQEKNAELESQYQILMETEKAASLGNLVAGVAHEINTPLGVSLTTASYLKKVNQEQRKKLSEGAMGREDLKDLMGVIDESVHLLETNLNRAAELVKSFKQVAADQSSGNIGEFSLKETIDGVILSLRHEYKHVAVQIQNQCPETIVLHSYPGAITQIITNLIMNTLQHGLQGVPQGRIRISASVQGEKIQLIYEDNGVGIPKENLKKIYDPFFTTQRKAGNTGLGMHIVMNLMTQRLQGSIKLESEEHQGVRFVMEMPLQIKA